MRRPVPHTRVKSTTLSGPGRLRSWRRIQWCTGTGRADHSAEAVKAATDVSSRVGKSIHPRSVSR